MAGFSDAEWYCILKNRIGNKTGLGQVIDAAHGERLLDVIKRRQHDPRFYFAIPKVLWTLPGMAEGQIDWICGRHDIKISAFERDMLTDDLARDAELFTFINMLRSHSIVLIGNENLRECTFLKYRHFVEISTPNLHLESGGIERAVECAMKFGEPGIYLVSAGVSAAIIIDLLHDAMPRSWFIDCGSIWDAFVGIGGQRQWRAELYADPEKYKAWVNKNLYNT
jgi:hypothetical protein